MFVVNSLDEVAEVAASAGDDVVLIFDVDNTLAPQGADPDELGKLVEAAIDRFEHDPAVRRVIVMTNGRQRGLSQVISRGNKPFTTRRRLGLDDSSGPVLVIGDQVLTDGLLAWRLRATFLHLVVDKASEDAQQARMRRVGRVAEPLLFRPPTTKCNG
jgi:predicted HAD superfamily phosphohydrolase YqeG